MNSELEDLREENKKLKEQLHTFSCKFCMTQNRDIATHFAKSIPIELQIEAYEYLVEQKVVKESFKDDPKKLFAWLLDFYNPRNMKTFLEILKDMVDYVSYANPTSIFSDEHMPESNFLIRSLINRYNKDRNIRTNTRDFKTHEFYY